MVWVAFAWATRPLQREFSSIQRPLKTKTRYIETESHAFSHLIFALSFGLCAYNFFRAMTLDPGTCPVPTSDAELKSVGTSFVKLLTSYLTLL